MEENISKEIVEKITSSKYFETLVDEQIKLRISELYKRNKWLFRTFSVFIIIICFILGYNFYDFNSQINRYKQRIDELDTKAKENDEIRRNLEVQLGQINITKDNYENLIGKEESLYGKKEKLNEDYQQLLQTKIDEVDVLDNNMRKQVKINDSLVNVIGEMITKASSTLALLTSVYQDTISPALIELNKRTNQIEMTSSIRYIFAERSDREPTGSEFRPVTIKLPFSEDVLKVVFHQVINDENPKEVLVDFYLNKNNKAFNQAVITEFNEFQEKNIQFTTVNQNVYEIEPVFIYLPPNPLFQRIPDFVILKLSLVEKFNG